MTFMRNYSRGEVVLVRYPFSDLSGAKVRPAVIVSAPHVSRDVFIIPLTSRIATLLPGEFALQEWSNAGLNVATAVKRGVYTVQEDLIVQRVGNLSASDIASLNSSLRSWMGM
jgi:mRNA interferase MazF